MSDIALALDDADLDIQNGDLYLTTGPDATRQRLQQNLLAYLGEWFLDLSSGVAYYQTILVKNPNAMAVETELRQAILATPGVKELSSFSLSMDTVTRELIVDFDVVDLGGNVIDFSGRVGGISG